MGGLGGDKTGGVCVLTKTDGDVKEGVARGGGVMGKGWMNREGKDKYKEDRQELWWWWWRWGGGGMGGGLDGTDLSRGGGWIVFGGLERFPVGSVRGVRRD